MKQDQVFTPEDWLTDLESLLSDTTKPTAMLPDSISLLGFIEFTRLEERLFEALNTYGVEVQSHQPCRNEAKAKVYEFLTPEDEWLAAAKWARSGIRSGAKRLAIVINEQLTLSGQYQERISQVLSAVFHPMPAACLDESGIQDFHFPKASSLIENSTIADALMLIRLSLKGAVTDQEFPVVSRLLLSPHWAGSDSESYPRALLELHLREAGIYRNSLAGICRQVHATDSASELAILIEKFSGLASASGESVRSSWFHEILGYWGWPGRGCDPGIARVTEQFSSLLETLSGINFNSYERALECLEMMAAGSFVSKGGGLLSPVQVVTPEVAAAGDYDGMWICHMDETAWPPPISNNPYLPASAQKAIPRMQPEGQLSYYSKLTEMLCQSADEVVFSWSADAGQGPRCKSSQLAEFESQKGEVNDPVYVSSEALGIVPGGRTADETPVLLPVEDEVGVAFPASGEVSVPGGSGFFRLQAACPLAGYLRYRLWARFPSAPAPLTNPMFRGELLHQALRELYRDAERRGTIPATDDVVSAVRTAMIRLHARERLGSTVYRAEESTLTNLLNEWLKVDLVRENLRVESLEENFRLSLGRLKLNVRPDRIDRLADNQFLVIDYKSGGSKSRALKWTRERMQEPQLPLYAVLLEEAGLKGAMGGLAFAVVRPGQCGFDGIGAGADIAIKGVRVAGQKGRGGLPSFQWQSLRDHWYSQLRLLGEEILAGQAANLVYDADIVQYSGLGLVLRHVEAGRNGNEAG